MWSSHPKLIATKGRRFREQSQQKDKVPKWSSTFRRIHCTILPPPPDARRRACSQRVAFMGQGNGSNGDQPRGVDHPREALLARAKDFLVVDQIATRHDGRLDRAVLAARARVQSAPPRMTACRSSVAGMACPIHTAVRNAARACRLSMRFLAGSRPAPARLARARFGHPRSPRRECGPPPGGVARRGSGPRRSNHARGSPHVGNLGA